MAFCISMGEIDRARSVAERALETINYRCVGVGLWVGL